MCIHALIEGDRFVFKWQKIKGYCYCHTNRDGEKETIIQVGCPDVLKNATEDGLVATISLLHKMVSKNHLFIHLKQ